MRKFTCHLDERVAQLLWRRAGRTWKSRLVGGRLSERLHYAFCVPWNENKAIVGTGQLTGERSIKLVIPDNLAPGGKHEVSWLFDVTVPDHLVQELEKMDRKPWQYKAHPNDPAPESRKRRKHRKKIPVTPPTEETSHAREDRPQQAPVP